MAENKFNAGDVVQLKSGGPRMTVVKFGSWSHGTKDGYQCKWFDEKNKVVTEIFSEAELELSK